MSFEQFNLDKRLRAGIERAGYTDPTPIQEAAIPTALAGRDLIATAQTGTGKTATFVLPMLHKLLNGPRHKSRALIVTPTRELAQQIHDNIRVLASGTGIRSTTIYGGVGPTPQIRALQSGVEIIVACPGRLLDLISQGHARLQNIELLVLDEADRMFDMGFLPDIRRIIKAIPAKRQTMLYSATFPKEVEKLATETLNNPERIAVGLTRPAHTVSHALYPVPKHLKTALTLEILKRTDTNSVLIFARTRRRAQRLSLQLSHAGYKVTSMHSDRTQSQRQSALNGFKEGRYQIMVATDIAARGLDVESISHVINFDIPDTVDAYVHRIGRTGRAERTGDAYTLISPEDDAMVRDIEKVMKQTLPQEKLSDFDYTLPAPPIQNQPAPRGPRPAKHPTSQRPHPHKPFKRR